MNGTGAVCVKKEIIFIVVGDKQEEASCACAKCEKKS